MIPARINEYYRDKKAEDTRFVAQHMMGRGLPFEV
jgi:hypothetical protein